MDGLTRIRNTLKDADMLVYEPGQKPGECLAPYVVVRDLGTYPTADSNKAGYTLAGVFCYVPLNEYAQLAGYAGQIKSLLAPLRDQLRPTGNIGADMIEEEYKAHSKCLEYLILKTL